MPLPLTLNTASAQHKTRLQGQDMALQQTQCFKYSQWQWGLILPTASVLTTCGTFCCPVCFTSVLPRSGKLSSAPIPHTPHGMGNGWSQTMLLLPHLSQPLPNVRAGASKAPRRGSRKGGGMSYSTGIPHSAGSWKAFRLWFHVQNPTKKPQNKTNKNPKNAKSPMSVSWLSPDSSNWWGAHT